MRSWAGVAGLIILLGLVVIGTPLWTNYASASPGVASAITAGLGLVVAILVLVVYWRQANIMEHQENLQRAWLVAGMGPTHLPQMDDEGQPKIGPNGRPMVCCQPNFHNYGNTPAFVQYLDWGFCSDPPPVQPDWRACTRTLINNWADTSGAAKPIEVSPAHELMEKGTIIFYGRLTYLDVLKAKRWTGFIYRWHADGTHERLGDRYSKYVEWN
jgi:hypothetical protein